MKKIFVIIAILAFAFTSCDSGDVIGGRYYGTFHNNLNNLREEGSLSFTYVKIEEETYFLMNGLLTMGQTDKQKFTGIATASQLEDLLKTMPAIDSIQVCDSTETVTQIEVQAEFKSGSVQSNLIFTTSNDKTVNVDFTGYFE